MVGSAKPGTPGELTRLLQAWSRGDRAAEEQLLPLVYAELRQRAAARLKHERPGHTLRPTELVHETYLRLCRQNPAWENREQFFAVAARLMRRVLVDHARALDVSLATANREWAMAKAWLYRRLKHASAEERPR
jgi:DNA-directed RNA polymerase specialized sigma24 family protein